MKTQNELYTYCVDKNLRTKEWYYMLKRFALEKMNDWESEAVRYGNYYPVVVKFNWQVGIELMGILVNECNEQVIYQTVLQVADRICQRIGRELTESMRLRGDMDSVAIIRVNRWDEAVMYLGPLDDRNADLFSDHGIMMTDGYNAYMNRRNNW